MLASKIEEKFKTLREVIYIFHRIFLRRRGLKIVSLELGGAQYTAWKSELLTMEMYVLKELGFGLYTATDHPHKYLLYFVRMLHGDNALAQLAWNYLNDCARLPTTLRHSAQTVACAAIYLAARKLQVVLPEGGRPWWRIMGADLEAVLQIGEDVLQLYRASPQVRLVA